MSTGVDHALHRPVHPVRFITAASLFDGHDAAINIMRRILQSQGAEVIHLGHNRSVAEVVSAAVEEDVQGIAVSSYQGGHVEYFRYLVDLLRERGSGHIRVYGGGGGVIVPSEIAELHDHGVAHIFTPQDGQRLGLAAMVNTMIAECDTDLAASPPRSLAGLFAGDRGALARVITCLEGGTLPAPLLDDLRVQAGRRAVPTLGITGTGGSGKSSLTDELIRRVRLDTADKLKVAVIAVDPTRRKGGGALLGDRIRMNAVGEQVYMRSLATRSATAEVPAVLEDMIAACRCSGADLVIVETPGIGQGDAAIVPFVDVPVYVMTPEFGAASQLEKIDMLDFADAVVINKFDRRGGPDAMRDVRRQLARNRELFAADPAELPVFGTIAARFNDDGVSALYGYLRDRLVAHGLPALGGSLPAVDGRTSTLAAVIVPPDRTRYLAEVAETIRRYHRHTAEQSRTARRRQALASTITELRAANASTEVLDAVAALHADAEAHLDASSRTLLEGWPGVVERYSGDERVDDVPGRAV